MSRAVLSGDGKRVVIVYLKDKTARIWDAEIGREIAVLKGHNESLSNAAFSSDRTRVVTASIDGTARTWDVETGKEIAVLNDLVVEAAAFSGDG